MQVIKLDVVVPNDHKLTLTIPNHVPPGPAEVVILTKEQFKEREKTQRKDMLLY